MLALVRLGVPPEIAQYIVSIDIKGLTVIGTPKLRQTWKAAKEQCFHDISQDIDPEKIETFTAQRGTGQDDVSSSLLWIAFFDILLCALDTKIKQSEFYIKTKNDELIPV